MLQSLMGKNPFAFFFIFLLLSSAFSSVSAAPSSKIINGFLSKAFSALLKWIWSLIGSTKTAISGRPVMKYEGGYTVETVFDGSKLGIEPYSVQSLPGGDILLLDSINSNIYRVSSPLSRYSRPKLVAGSYEGYSGHVDGKPREARLNHPKGFAVDDRGNIYIADAMNMAIRKVGEAGVTTIAGGKWSRGGPIDGTSEDATFSNDFDLVYVGSSCSLLVIDRGNRAIREIQLQYDDCANQYDVGFPLGIGVLVLAGFFGYMLALLQRRVFSTLSSQSDMTSRKQNINLHQQPLKSSGRPSLIPLEDELGNQEGFFVSVTKLILNSWASFVEIVGALFGFKRKLPHHQLQFQYPQQRKHPNGWPLQDSFVIPEEDEPPSAEVTTPTPKKTYAFMAKEPEKTHHVRQSRPNYNGWNTDFSKQRQQKQQQHYRQQYPSGSQTFYEQSCASTNDIIFGAARKQDEDSRADIIKRLNFEDPAYDYQNLSSRSTYSDGSSDYW